MPDEINQEYLEKLEKQLNELKSERETSAARLNKLEERLKARALQEARAHVLDDVVKESGLPLDVSQAAKLLERLTADAAALVNDDGEAFVSDEQQAVIREQAQTLISSLKIPAKIVPPPIVPGEPPNRRNSRVLGGGIFGNSWDTKSKTGLARGKDLIAKAAGELEQNGVL